MSANESSSFALSNDPEGKGALLLPGDNFIKRESLAEMVIPYSYPTDVKNIFSAIARTKMKRYLIDIDGPWVYSVGLSVLVAIPCAIMWVHRVWHQIGSHQVFMLLFLATLMVTLPLLIPTYFLVAFTNLRLKYGKGWLRTIMGPTHIGLTTSGIKFYWKGKFFYNYPLLRVWSAVEKVDLELPTEENPDVVPAIAFNFAPRPFYKTRIVLPLNGFSSKESLIRFLMLVQQWAPKSAFGSVLESESDSNFKGSLSAFESLDVDHLLENKAPG